MASFNAIFCNLFEEASISFETQSCVLHVLLHLISECNAGYYEADLLCVVCPGNRLKIKSGNASDCNADPQCNGINMVANTEHTACGKLYCFLH